jgi:hypothetical protein
LTFICLDLEEEGEERGGELQGEEGKKERGGGKLAFRNEIETLKEVVLEKPTDG